MIDYIKVKQLWEQYKAAEDRLKPELLAAIKAEFDKVEVRAKPLPLSDIKDVIWMDEEPEDDSSAGSPDGAKGRT